MEGTVMAFTADVTTDLGKVRLLLFDMDVDAPIFPDDAQIQALLDIEDGEVKLAAALGLETIASNRVLTLQVIQLLDLKTDGASVAKALLAVAQQYRNNPGGDWSGFDIAEVVDDSPFAYRDKYLKLLWAGDNAGPARTIDDIGNVDNLA